MAAPIASDGGAEPVGGRGAVPGGQGAAGLPQAAGVALLHFRLRHLRGFLGLVPSQHRVRPPQPQRPHQRQLRLPLQAAPGVFRGPLVRGGPPRARVSGGRSLLGRSVLRHRRRRLFPLRPRRPRGLLVRPAGLPSGGEGPPHRPGGDGSAGVPVAGQLLRLGGGAGRGEGGHGPRGGAGPGGRVPAAGGAVPGAGGTPDLGAQHLGGVRVSQPGALDGESLVRFQGDGLGGAGGARPSPRGGPRKSRGPGGRIRPPRGRLRPRPRWLLPARGWLPTRLRPGGVRGPPLGWGVRAGSPHFLRQPDVGSSRPAGGAVPTRRPPWRRSAGGGAWPEEKPRPQRGGDNKMGGA